MLGDVEMKSIAWKIAIIVFAAVLIVAGSVTVYMETRILSYTDRYARSELKNQKFIAVQEYNLTFTDAAYVAKSIREFVETCFDVNEYKNDAENYFDESIKPLLDGFVYDVVDKSSFISSAYFAAHPNLAGYPLVNEVYYERTDEGIVDQEPQTYEEYMQTDSEEMEWFYGAYNSSQPYWTHIYEWSDGEIMVSYAEPIIINGVKVGVAGVDVPTGSIEELVRDYKAYDTGFALFEDKYGDFFMTNSFIQDLSNSDRELLTSAARANRGEVFEIKLDGKSYIVAHAPLMNDYIAYTLVPKSEFNAESTRSLLLFCVLFVVMLVVVLFVSTRIGKTFSKPLVALSNYMHRAGSTGDITLNDEEMRELRNYAQRKDEIGVSIAGMISFEELVMDIEESLETLADGDYSCIVPERSESDIMSKACNRMINSMLSALWRVTNSAAEVSADSSQIAAIAHTLSDNSTEQTGAVHSLSDAIGDIASYTKDNAGMAGQAASLASTIKTSAEKGNHQMSEMMTAVRDIDQASHGINKVMKVIDDIAFQTNILALNAAVEAARAGQHGKGFAVVAEEVRNLAAKSAEAAKDSGELIADTIHKAELGSQIANFTAASLEEIVSGINESSKLIEDIAASSGMQLDGIEQINSSISRVSQIVQHNSETAGESASASTKMREQSQNLEELIKHFRLRDRRIKKEGAPPPSGDRRMAGAPGQASLPSARHNIPAISDKSTSGLGKY